jgi:hypothetical protein
LNRNVSSTESDERYEVVVKHYLKGVLHVASFKTLEKAHAFLMARWAELPVERGMEQIDCAAGIYDKHESGIAAAKFPNLCAVALSTALYARGQI